MTRTQAIAIIEDARKDKIKDVETFTDAELIHEAATEMLTLIERIVTGDGEQPENIDMSEAEWEAELKDDDGNDDIEITIDKDDWMGLVRIARSSAQ